MVIVTAPDAVPESEVHVLGALLRDPDAVEETSSLEPDAFRSEPHELIFRAAIRLHDAGHEVTPTTVSEELERNGHLQEAGGLDYLVELFQKGGYGGVRYHVERLREEHRRRELDGLGRAIQLAAGRDEVPGDELQKIEERLHALRNGRQTTEGPAPTAQEILDDPEARRRPPTAAELLGWRELLTLLVGQPKDGKSTLLRWAVARRSPGLAVWRDEEPGDGPMTVVYHGEERPVDIAADLYRMGAALGRIHVRDMRRHPGDREALLRRDVEAVGPDLIVIDTLATYTENLDIDPWKSTAWGPVFNPVGVLAQEANAAALVSHHARKSDGRARDSNAIEACVDVVLEMGRDPDEGENVRRVRAKPRSAAPAKGFKYLFTDFGGAPRLELLDGSLSLEERVQRFVRENPECSQRDAREGVRGRNTDIREVLEKLSGAGGPLICDDSDTPYRYSLR